MGGRAWLWEAGSLLLSAAGAAGPSGPEALIWQTAASLCGQRAQRPRAVTLSGLTQSLPNPGGGGVGDLLPSICPALCLGGSPPSSGRKPQPV